MLELRKWLRSVRAGAAGGTASSAAASGAFGGGRIVTAQDGGTEYHGTYPYVDPGSGGHYNNFTGVTDGILPNGTVYGELIMQPLGMYFWEADEWLPLLATEWSFTTTDTFADMASSATPEAATDEANTFEIKLREGVVWSDDTPFTSQDVVDTLWCYRILSSTVWQYIDNVVAVDDLTVHCHMSAPSTVVERYVIRLLTPRPSAVFGEFAEQSRDVFMTQGKSIDDPEGAQLLEQFSTFRPELPPCSGPYQIDEASISNAQMTLVKNDKAWNAD